MPTKRPAFLAFSLAMLAGLAFTSPIHAAAGASDGHCVLLEAGPSDRPTAPRNGTYKAKATTDIELLVRFLAAPNTTPDPAGDRISFRFLAPGGSLYQEVEVPVAEPARPEKQRTMPGYPFPVTVVAATRAGTAANGTAIFEVRTRFPVGGTQITANGLFGLWTVEARRSGTPTCTATFTLQP
jgi:hypothetical protein